MKEYAIIINRVRNIKNSKLKKVRQNGEFLTIDNIDGEYLFNILKKDYLMIQIRIIRLFYIN